MRRDALDVMDARLEARARRQAQHPGGLVAQALALESPRVKSLTLMCTFSQGKRASRFDPWLVWVGTRTYVGTRGCASSPSSR